jgi:site-specific DNA-methyltransferase (adenine-specific)
VSGAAAVLAGTAQWSILEGDVRARLKELPDGCISTCITSPPYFGLRSYSTTPQIWGGTDPDCDHQLVDAPPGKVLTGGTGAASAKQVTNAGSQYGNAWSEPIRAPWANDVPGPNAGGKNDYSRNTSKTAGQVCTRCNAWLGELGSEPDVNAFVAHLVDVFREVWRVLRADGVCFVNLGDSFSGSGKGPTGHNGIGDQGQRQGFTDQRSGGAVPAKSLYLVPERFVLAMQEAGWIVRDRIVWSKLSCMPESVLDRCTQSWEHLYQFVKQPRYWWDAEAIRQPFEGRPQRRLTPRADHPKDERERQAHTPYAYPVELADVAGHNGNPAGANCRNVWTLGPDPSDYDYCAGCDTLYQGVARRMVKTRDGVRPCPACQATDRWVGHFAAFPKALPERAILAACPPRCCAVCGAGWTRITERSARNKRPHSRPPGHRHPCEIGAGHSNGAGATTLNYAIQHTTIGWEPGCTHDADTVPGVVLDPFSGSGTTGLVATRLGRRYVGIELSESYAQMSRKRIAEDAPLLEAAASADGWEQAALFEAGA